MRARAWSWCADINNVGKPTPAQEAFQCGNCEARNALSQHVAMRRVDCDAVQIHNCYRMSSFLGNRCHNCNLQRDLALLFRALAVRDAEQLVELLHRYPGEP